MALKKKNAVDDTLEVVRDLDTFKDRIEQLAKATTAHDKAAKKSADKNKILFAEHDAAVAAHDVAMASAKDALRSVEKAAAEAMNPVIEAEAKLIKGQKALAKAEEAVSRESLNNAMGVETLRKDRLAFNAKVKQFTETVIAANKALD